MQWAPFAAVLGAFVGAIGTYLGVLKAQRETLRREMQLSQWKLSADTYVDVIAWTGWVQHWYIVGSPDPHERPYTVTMARIAARLTAFGDQAAGDAAFALLTELRPHVSNKDISGDPPPPDHIRILATDLAGHAQRRLTDPMGQGPRTRSR